MATATAAMQAVGAAADPQKMVESMQKFSRCAEFAFNSLVCGTNAVLTQARKLAFLLSVHISAIRFRSRPKLHF